MFIDIIHQFVAPNKKVIEDPKVMLTFNLCKLLIFFFNTKVDIVTCKYINIINFDCDEKYLNL